MEHCAHTRLSFYIITPITEHYSYDSGESRKHNEGKDERPFWHLDEEIGEGRFYDEPATIRLKAHISEDRYHRAGETDEIIPLREKSGTRIYVMARPYILEPDYNLTVGSYPQPTEQSAIGAVTSSDWVGMRQREIGQAQAWLYPQERTLVLWECFLEHWYRQQDPRTDNNLKSTWLGFEGFLLRNLPQQINRIATPSWEPLYDQDRRAWPDFLETIGYKRVKPLTYCKAWLKP